MDRLINFGFTEMYECSLYQWDVFLIDPYYYILYDSKGKYKFNNIDSLADYFFKMMGYEAY